MQRAYPDTSAKVLSSGLNFYERLIKWEGQEIQETDNLEELRRIQSSKQRECLHSRMVERIRKFHGVADRYLPRFCALWTKEHSLYVINILSKVRNILGLYVKRDDSKCAKISDLKTFNTFELAAS